ncbi:MAG: DUF5681 domain-containing protein [Pseudomonadota bacterium]
MPRSKAPRYPRATAKRHALKDDDYSIGRAKPPKHTQFKKGQSGNKAGRPKGSKNLSTLIMEAAHGQVTATIDGKQRKISKVQATTMQLATKAAAGDPKAMLKFLDWVDEIEARAAAARPSQYPLSEADVEVIKAVHDRLWAYGTNPFA